MHLQPNRNYRSNDDVQTPLRLAAAIADHFKPRGRVLEPCAAGGSFIHALTRPELMPFAPRGPRRFDPRNPDKGAWFTLGEQGICERLPRTQRTAEGGGTRRPKAEGEAEPGSAPAPVADRITRVDWCEIKRGRDFFAWHEKVDWVVTNPPWSQFREFLRHAMEVSDNVVFLVTINHLWTRARIRDVTTAGFGLKEIVMVDTPATFPPLGFQLGAVHLSRGWKGPVTLTDVRCSVSGEAVTERDSAQMVGGADRVKPPALKRSARVTDASALGARKEQYGASAVCNASKASTARKPVAARGAVSGAKAARGPEGSRRASRRLLPSQWMTGRELAALTPQEHLRLILGGV